MNGILYFSATGNSLYIAKKMKELLGGEIKYIPKYQGNGSEYEKLFIVSPIHSFGLPKQVYDFIPNLYKNVPIIIILNYGGMKGGADIFTVQYLKKLGLNIKSVYSLKMPESFTLSFTVPKFYLNSILKKADNKIEKIICQIKSEKYHLPIKGKTKEKTYLKNKERWHLIGERFKVNDKCIKCGKCINLCPVKNISFENGEIKFGESCVACLGCYHRCPQKSITYQNKKKKFRYINPNIKEEDIGV